MSDGVFVLFSFNIAPPNDGMELLDNAYDGA